MRPITIFLAVALATLPSYSMAQHVNWRSMEGQHRHLITGYFGVDNGSYYGLSYEYHLPRAVVPIGLGAGARVPFGDQALDDWQLGLGAQGEAWRSGDLSLGVGSGLLLRRYESPLARLYNAGLEVNVSFGLTGQKWSAVAIARYDDSSLTHIKHKLLREYYPEIRDGWYDADGGNFRFGASTGFAGRSWGAVLTTGRIFGQDFRDNPTLPFFAEIALRRGL